MGGCDGHTKAWMNWRRKSNWKTKQDRKTKRETLTMTNIHLIFNAHLDPIWLWPWTAGLDEALATCRSACDRLDTHPELRFTRGEAWVYRQIEDIDPQLFARIQAFVQDGRWEITGGWWIQPDCNLPSGFALEQQIRLGKEYFEERFGQFPSTAYNVDSFGHAAALPRLMHKYGQTQYVMMRPQQHEMALPARLFRWQGEQDGPEVVTFRIASAYTTREPDCTAHILQSLTHLPPGVQDTMCFIGVGDHGGGPTEAQIAWLQANKDAFPGCRLFPSSVSRFFEAVAPHIPALPRVTGELQMHAIGCYSVERAVKVGVRRAEHALHQAQLLTACDPAGLKRGWEYTCFHQFHDTLGGTCIPSAYRDVYNQLGFAQAVAGDALNYELRRRLNALPACTDQRMVFWNASDMPFDGSVEAEPWTDLQTWQPQWHLQDEAGQTVAYQTLVSEALNYGYTRLLLPLSAGPGEMRVLRLKTTGVADDAALAPFSAAASFPVPAVLGFGNDEKSLRLVSIPDASDTWSHGLDRYAEDGDTAQWSPLVSMDDGSLLRSWRQEGRVGESRLRAEWRLLAGQPYSELRLSVDWRETHKVLKLVLPLPLTSHRTDGVLGGQISRPNDGRELPLQNWTLLQARAGAGLGVVCPDVFAGDADAARVRLTLLRSALMAQHEPFPAEGPRAVVSDQGPHEFRFEFWAEGEAPEGGFSASRLEARGIQLQRPLLFADLTRGMKPNVPERLDRTP